MQIKVCRLALACLMLSACAANQKVADPELNAAAGVVLTSGGSPDAMADGLSVCSVKEHGDQDRLDQNCLNRVDGLPNAGKRHNAVGREIKELPSICDQRFLPKCRRKY